MLKGKLTENFHADEFMCKCGCGTNYFDLVLVSSLQQLRNMLNRPLIINCACRCPKHNADVGGAPESYHLSTITKLCQAVDLRCDSSSFRYHLVSSAMKLGFNGIGIYPSFVHLDLRNETPRIWIEEQKNTIPFFG